MATAAMTQNEVRTIKDLRRIVMTKNSMRLEMLAGICRSLREYDIHVEPELLAELTLSTDSELKQNMAAIDPPPTDPPRMNK